MSSNGSYHVGDGFHPRTLALRVAPIEGEALDSWIDACCRRHRVTLGEFYLHMSMPGVGRRDVVRDVSPRDINRMASATGVAARQIEAMTASSWFPEADGYCLTPVAAEHQVYPRTWAGFWLLTTSSRYCPRCLNDSGGRWQLSWRSRWAFACTRHGCMLLDVCPHCGGKPRRRRITRRRPQASSCDCPGEHYGEICGFDFQEAAAPALDPDSPVLHAQSRIDELLEAERAQSVSSWAPMPLLHDVAQLVRLTISYGERTKIESLGSACNSAVQSIRTTDDMARCSMRNAVPSSAFAAAAALALGVLDTLDIDLAAALLDGLLPVPSPYRHLTNLHLEMNAWARKSWLIEMLWDRVKATQTPT